MTISIQSLVFESMLLPVRWTHILRILQFSNKDMLPKNSSNIIRSVQIFPKWAIVIKTLLMTTR